MVRLHLRGALRHYKNLKSIFSTKSYERWILHDCRYFLNLIGYFVRILILLFCKRKWTELLDTLHLLVSSIKTENEYRWCHGKNVELLKRMISTKSKFHHIQTEPYGRYDMANLCSYFSKMIRLIHFFIQTCACINIYFTFLSLASF